MRLSLFSRQRPSMVPAVMTASGLPGEQKRFFYQFDRFLEPAAAISPNRRNHEFL